MAYGLHERADVEPSWAGTLRAWGELLPPTAAFTHLTSAKLRGWWLPTERDPGIHVAVSAQDRHPQRPGLFVTRHSSAIPSELVEGIRCATAAETLLAAARDLGILDVVLMGDCALRRQDCSIEDLQLVSQQRRRGARRLRTVIPSLDHRSESAWESIMRVLHVAADIPVEPQKNLFDGRNRFVARADLWIAGTARIHEYDGAKHREREVHRRDLNRDRRLIEAGFQRFGYTAGEIRSGGSIISSTDRLLGRRWDPRRLQRWAGLVRDSTATNCWKTPGAANSKPWSPSS